MAVTADGKSLRVTAEVIPLYNPVPTRGTAVLTIAAYSFIRSIEVQTSYIDFDMGSGQTLDMKFGIRHESYEETARLQFKFYTKKHVLLREGLVEMLVEESQRRNRKVF